MVTDQTVTYDPLNNQWTIPSILHLSLWENPLKYLGLIYLFSGCEYGDRQNCSAISSYSCYNETQCCKTCSDFKRLDLPTGKK